jgi:basic membrane protein A
LFFPIFQPEGDFIIQQSATVAGLGDTVMMAADGLLNSNYMALGETEGMFFSGPDVRYGANFNQSTGESAADVLADYEAEFGEAPAAPFWAHSYDAAVLLMDAIVAASTDDAGTLTIDRAGVREYLHGVSNFSGLIGSMSCDPYGDCSSAKITVIQNIDSTDYAASTANVVYEYAPLAGGQAAGEVTAPEGACIGLVTDVGEVDDKSFNQAAWTGVETAGAQFGADVDYVETQAAKDYATNIGLFADSGCDIIVTVGFALGEATAVAAAEYPDVDFIGVDQWQAEPVDGVAGLIFPEDQSGFLAGALAASLSTSGTIAAVLGTDIIPPVVAFGEGYLNGAKWVNPDIEVIKTYHPGGLDVAFTDPEWGATTARQALDQGADVVFGAGGKTGNGAIIEVAGEAGAFCIGVDVDQWGSVPEAQPCLVSSAMKSIAEGVVYLIGESLRGNMPSGNHVGGADLAPFHEHADSVPDSVKDMLVQLKADLDAGVVPTCVWVTDAPGCPVPRTASWRGVTEDEIHVGVTMIDFPWLIEMGLSTEGWGDPQTIWEALLAEVNGNGGVHGRQIVVDGYRYYSPVPGMGISAEGVCLELAADIETFAIVGGFLGPSEISNTCITATANTILIGGRQTAEWLAESTAPWLEFGTMKERRMEVFLSLLDQEGLLEGRTFALVGGMDGPYEKAKELITGMGIDLALDAFNDVTVGDTEAEDARWDVLVENVRSSGADTIFLVGGERAGIRNLSYAGIDIDMYVMNSETYTSLSASVTPEMADGGITLTGMTPEEQWETEGTQACAATFREANPDIETSNPTDWVEGEKWYTGITNYCNWVAVLVAVLEAAGPNPTHESFLAGVESMTQFSSPSSPYSSFGPGKYDASDSFRLSVFDGSEGAGEDGLLTPMGPVLDGTP